MNKFFSQLLSFLFIVLVLVPNNLYAGISLSFLSTLELEGDFDDGAAEISAFDPASEQLFTINSATSTIDIIDLSDPENPSVVDSIDLSAFGDGITSVDVSVDGIVAAAVAADPETDPGTVVFLNTDGMVLSSIIVGSLPDSVKFTPDGATLVVANEGEPGFDEIDDEDVFNGTDPEGSISIIDVSGGAANVMQADLSTADFTTFNGMVLDSGIRIIGPDGIVQPTVAQDLEPEFVTISDDSTTAFITIQENNAIAVVDIDTAAVTDLFGLGFKDHSLAGNGFDPSDEDGTINIATQPVMGMYQPDGMAFYSMQSGSYLITANEGDSRGFEETSVEDVTLDPEVFPNAAALQLPELLGELEITSVNGSDDGGQSYQEIFAFGARSFSIWDADTGAQVFDSGDDFEQITAMELPTEFNSNNDENDSFDSRSNDAGPEPEGVAVGQIGESIYAFIGLERVGGVMVYNVTDPMSPSFVQYINNRDFSFDGDLEMDKDGAGDLAPEGIVFISADDSPNGDPILVVSNEVSGTVTLFGIQLISAGDGDGDGDDDDNDGGDGCSVVGSAVSIKAAFNLLLPMIVFGLSIMLRRFRR